MTVQLSCKVLLDLCPGGMVEQVRSTPWDPVAKNPLYNSLLSDLPQRRLFQDLRAKLLFKAAMTCGVVILKIGYR